MFKLQEVIDAGGWDAFHNVRLLGISCGDDGNVMLTMEVQGETVRTKTSIPFQPDSRWNAEQVGKVGMLRSEYLLDAPGFTTSFAAYPDQTLRRAPELDPTRRRGLYVTGWRCAARPRGFLAPAGLIPGENGQFVESFTTTITLEVPEEFMRLAREHQSSADGLLRGFIADVCGLQSYVSCPRADGYTSNGSDERMLAQDWLERAYGWNRINLAPIEEREEAREMAEQDLAFALDDFTASGGTPAEFVAAVQAIARAKVAEAAEGDQQ